MTNRVLTSLLLILSVASVAQAQPSLRLSAGEKAYGKRLGDALGSPAKVARLESRWTPKADVGLAAVIASSEAPTPGAPLLVRGLRVTLGDLVVRRLKLDDPAAAQLFAAHSELALAAPVVGEVRFDQVVFVTGEQVRDAAFARRALDAAWRGLPVQVDAADATFAVLGQRDVVLATTTAAGPLVAPIETLFASARKYAARPQRPGCTIAFDGANDVSVHFDVGAAAGLRTRAHLDASSASVTLAGAPERAADMTAYTATLTGGPRVGLAGALSGGSKGEAIASISAADDLLEGLGREALDVMSETIRRELETAVRTGELPVVDRPLGE